jgi:hypothetical protein
MIGAKRALKVILSIYVLTLIISFYIFPILCYTLEEVNSLLNATTNKMSAYGVKLSYHKDCK